MARAKKLVTDLAAFRKEKVEKRSAMVQTTFKPSEVESLDKFVGFCRANGVPGVTRSSAIRALVLDGIQVFEEDSDG